MTGFPTDWVWLEVLELGEPGVNALRIVVGEARVRETAKEMILPGVVIEAAPLTLGPDSRIFEILWETYVAYTVLNESYALPDETALPEPSSKSPLMEFKKSRFLEFVQSATWARDEYPGALVHWRLCCSWHCIDVVSWKPPEIRAIQNYRLPEIDLDLAKH